MARRGSTHDTRGQSQGNHRCTVGGGGLARLPCSPGQHPCGGRRGHPRVPAQQRLRFCRLPALCERPALARANRRHHQAGKKPGRQKAQGPHPDGHWRQQDVYQHRLHLLPHQVWRRPPRAVSGRPGQPGPPDQERVRRLRQHLQSNQLDTSARVVNLLRAQSLRQSVLSTALHAP